MKTILFLCHGNICRSVGAEFIFNKLIKESKLKNKYVAYSRALSNEEIGNDTYPPMKDSLIRHNIECYHHEAKRATLLDIETSDYVFYMDDENKYLVENEFGKGTKCQCLAQFINKQEIADPWFHRRFDDCFDEIYEAVSNLIKWLEKEGLYEVNPI